MVTGAAGAPDPTLDEVRERVAVIRQRMAQATDRYNEAREAVAAGRQRVADAKAAASDQQARLDELSDQMGGYAAALYRQGGVDPAVQVLLTDDPADFLAQSSTTDALLDHQLSALTAVQRQRSQLAQRRADLAEELAAVTAAERAVETERAAIEADLAESERLLASLEEQERERLAAEDAAGRVADPGAVLRTLPATGRGATALRFALDQLGEPYVYGAAGPSSWDCSGLTSAAWAAAGVSLSRSSRAQTGDGPAVARADLQPGDLVFFYQPVSHVALYLGGGLVIHAPHPGDVVSIVPLATMPFSGAVRPG
jgi:cell wall-associated NlpC family hydrolase